MREIRPSGSEGGARFIPCSYPILETHDRECGLMKFEYTGSYFRVVVELFEGRVDFARQRRRHPKLNETSRRRLLAQVIQTIKRK